jgi:antirestriction protein ArdC
MKIEQHKKIADAVIKMMQEHGSDWVKPWVTKGINDPNTPISLSTGKPYRGINWLILSMARAEHGYTTGRWATYKQWQSRGAQVKKGNRGQMVVLYKKIKVEDRDFPGTEKIIPLMRSFTVFNADQVEGYTAPEGKVDDAPTITPETAADTLAADVGAVVRHEDKFRAFYSPSRDFINMPDFAQFKTTTDYASTLCHELTHWTGNEARLDRSLKNKFGSKDYAAEELVAELGSAMLCGSLGFESTPRDDHAKYLNNWIEKLTDNPKAIFTAAAKAQAAADWLVQRQETKCAESLPIAA